MNHYRTIQGSLLRHAAKTATKLSEEFGEKVSVVNLDAFTDEKQWPQSAFVGLGEFHLSLNQVYEGEAILSIGLPRDANLLRSAEYIEVMLDDLLPNSSITLVHPDTGEVAGLLLIKGGVHIAPPLPTESRPLLPIIFSFTSNLQTS
jgi:hypothetical protein